MLDIMQTLTFSIGDPVDASALGDSASLWMLPYDYTIIYVSVGPYEDDAGATMDIQDDGTDIITAIACATHATPGEWISTAAGGAQTPVYVAAGSEIEFDFNNAAAGNRFEVCMVVLAGVNWG